MSDMSSMFEAIAQLDITALRAALRNPVDARDSDGATPLMRAAEAGFTDGVRLLLAAQADPHARDSSGRGIWRYVFSGDMNPDPELVRSLIEGGANPNDDDLGDGGPLITAANNGLVAVVDVLLAGGADVDAGNDRGETALAFAVVYGHGQVVARLRAGGADPNLRDRASGTALMFAVTQPQEQVDIVRQLLEYKGNPDLADHFGWTPLLNAVRNQYWRSASVLMQHVSDLTRAAPTGESALSMTDSRSVEEFKRFVAARAGCE